MQWLGFYRMIISTDNLARWLISATVWHSILVTNFFLEIIDQQT